MLFATILNISLHAKTPVKNEDINPIISIEILISLSKISPDKTSFSIAPNITGITIKKENLAAAKFSFLIVIPVIFGAILKDVLSGDIFDNEIKISILIIGFISSFLTGVLACKLMLRIVANNNLIYFSFYCFVLGIISIFII